MSAQELVELIAVELGGGCRAKADAVRVVAALRSAGYELTLSRVEPVRYLDENGRERRRDMRARVDLGDEGPSILAW